MIINNEHTLRSESGNAKKRATDGVISASSSWQIPDGENCVGATKDEVSSLPGATSNPRTGFYPHLSSNTGERIHPKLRYQIFIW